MININETNQDVYSNKPHLIIIRLLKKCTAKCKMCDFWKSTEKELNLPDLKHIINEAKNAGVKEICFTGGEPTHYSSFFEAISYLKSKGLQYSFITNGSLLSKSFIEKLMMLPPRSIYVSIDSPEEKMHDLMRGINGIWNKAFEGIITLNSCQKSLNMSNRPKIIINYIVTNQNFTLVPKMIALSKGSLFDEINLMQIKGMQELALNEKQIKEYNEFVAPQIIEASKLFNVSIRSGNPLIFGSSDNENKLFAKMQYSKHFYESHTCHVCDSMIFIETNGDVFPCNNTPYYGKEFCCGNILQKNLSTILSSKRMSLIREQMCGGELCTCCDPINQRINLEKSRQKQLCLTKVVN